MKINEELDMSNLDVLYKIGDFLFEKAKEDMEIVNLERERIAKQVNDMMKSGETDLVKQTPTGIIIGNPEVAAKLNALKAELGKLDYNR